MHEGFEMLKDERDVVEVLKSELEYLRNGSYSERESWGPRFIFEDSPTCLNFGHRDNPIPCSGCVLMDFVPLGASFSEIPMPPYSAGRFRTDARRSLSSTAVKRRLKRRSAIGCKRQSNVWREERQAYRQKDERTSFSSLWWRSARYGQESTGIPLHERFHPKCANPACPAAFHWLAGGKFFRFRPEEDVSSNENQPKADSPTGHQGVKHYWLCERCSHLFTLVYEQEQGIVLKVRLLGLPVARASGGGQ